MHGCQRLVPVVVIITPPPCFTLWGGFIRHLSCAVKLPPEMKRPGLRCLSERCSSPAHLWWPQDARPGTAQIWPQSLLTCRKVARCSPSSDRQTEGALRDSYPKPRGGLEAPRERHLAPGPRISGDSERKDSGLWTPSQKPE